MTAGCPPRSAQRCANDGGQGQVRDGQAARRDPAGARVQDATRFYRSAWNRFSPVDRNRKGTTADEPRSGPVDLGKIRNFARLDLSRRCWRSARLGFEETEAPQVGRLEPSDSRGSIVGFPDFAVAQSGLLAMVPHRTRLVWSRQ